MEELLKELFGDAVTSEALQKINAEMGKKFVAKADFNAKNDEVKALKSEKATLEGKITELTEKANGGEDYKTQLEALKQQIADEKAQAEKKKADTELTSAIEAVFGDKEFTSDYVRQGIIADMKTEIAKPENKGKGYSELFEGLIKDKDGIIKNPNPPAPMSGMGGINPADITPEKFAKMSYRERNDLYRSNKELYENLTKKE